MRAGRAINEGLRVVLTAGFIMATTTASVAPAFAEVPQTSEDHQRAGGGPGGGGAQAPRGPQGGGAGVQAPRGPEGGAPRAAAPPAARAPQPGYSQGYDRGDRGRRGGYDGPRYGGGYGGGYGGYGYGGYDDAPVYRRRPTVVYDEPGYGGYGRACATSRGVCYVRRPQPYGSGCRCDIPGFGLKRGNIEG